MKAEGLFTDANVAKGANNPVDKPLEHKPETYEKLYKIGDLIYNKY